MTKTSVRMLVQDVTHADALEMLVRAQVEKLALIFPNLRPGQIDVERPHRHDLLGNCAKVLIEMQESGNEPIAKSEPLQKMYLRLREAFDAGRRPINKPAEQKRREPNKEKP